MQSFWFFGEVQYTRPEPDASVSMYTQHTARQRNSQCSSFRVGRKNVIDHDRSEFYLLLRCEMDVTDKRFPHSETHFSIVGRCVFASDLTPFPLASSSIWRLPGSTSRNAKFHPVINHQSNQYTIHTHSPDQHMPHAYLVTLRLFAATIFKRILHSVASEEFFGIPFPGKLIIILILFLGFV